MSRSFSSSQRVDFSSLKSENQQVNDSSSRKIGSLRSDESSYCSEMIETNDDDDEDDISTGLRSSKAKPKSFNLDGSENERNKIYLSVIQHSNKLGVSYYDLETTILYVTTDVIEIQDFYYLKQCERPTLTEVRKMVYPEVAANVLTQIKPSVVITSAKQKERFLDVLREAERSTAGGDCTCCIDRLEVLPNNVFALDMSKRRILSLNGLPGLSKEAGDEERNIYFNSLVSFENTSTVSATGGLLKFLDQARTGIELEDAGTQVPILMIKTFSIQDLMIIDDHTYTALQIFQKEAHPSVYKSGGSACKEGLSLFGIMNHTKSQEGSHMLRSWFLRPSTNITLLNQRLKAIQYFISPRNMEALVSLQDGLKSMKNLMRILAKMKSAGVSMLDWQNLYKVDFEESLCLNHFVVKEGIDAELDERFFRHGPGSILKLHHTFSLYTNIPWDQTSKLYSGRKRTFDGIPYLMTQVAQKELAKLNDSITKCSVTYLPQLGYLLNIPLTQEMSESQNYNIDERLEFMFTAEDLVYYKSAGTIELDEKLGDIQCDIRDHEMNIMHRLQDVVLQHTNLLNDVIDLSAQLDCILALTTAAKECNFTPPELLDASDNKIEIVGGRHPLQEMCVNQFVVNDTYFGNEHGKVKILTGPNASGKSVYLKQVGLIVYLAHIGSFVPAESAKISIKDAIFTRIRTIETVSVPLSTFMIDLNQIAYSVGNATKNSLVIIDEFGKGTVASDGLALLYSVLDYWLQKGADGCPYLLVSTHFHKIRHMMPESALLKYQTMDVLCSDDDLVFLYQLRDGSAEYSYACHTAKLASIPDNIIERANQITSCIRNNLPIQKKDNLSESKIQERMESIVDEFLSLDMEKDDIEGFLSRIAET